MKKLNVLIVATTIFLSASAAHAYPHSKLYTLKGEAKAGTLIPPVEATSTVPFNKRFNALTTEQQNLVRAKFNTLGENDTPPYPASGLQAVYKPLINANKNYGNNHPLKLTVTVNELGNVSNVDIHSDTNSRFTAYVERSLKRTKFEPAMCNGIACEMNFPLDITFN